MAFHLSIAAPAYNESAGICPTLGTWHAFLSRAPDIASFEIVICNDGSTDTTGQLLDELTTRYPQLIPLHLPTQQGAAVALSRAIAATRLDWVLILDTDNQCPIENLPFFLHAVQNNQDALVIAGIREQQQRAVRYRLGSRLSGTVCNLLYGSQLRDFNSAYKLIRGDVVRALLLETKGMNYSTEMTARLLERRIAIHEVVIKHLPRTSGRPTVSFWRASWHRLLFTLYLAIRQGLLKCGILHSQQG